MCVHFCFVSIQNPFYGRFVNIVKSVLFYTLLSEAKAADLSPLEPNITPQFHLRSQMKVLNPDKIAISLIQLNDVHSTYILFSAGKSREEHENLRKAQLLW